jgi:AraC-like DNA-binding protein
MTTKDREQLKVSLREIQKDNDWSLRALSQNIGVSHSYLSLFFNDSDQISPLLITKLKTYVADRALQQQAHELSKDDEKRLMEILEILEYATNKHAIITALTYG